MAKLLKLLKRLTPPKLGNKFVWLALLLNNINSQALLPWTLSFILMNLKAWSDIMNHLVLLTKWFQFYKLVLDLKEPMLVFSLNLPFCMPNTDQKSWWNIARLMFPNLTPQNYWELVKSLCFGKRQFICILIIMNSIKPLQLWSNTLQLLSTMKLIFNWSLKFPITTCITDQSTSILKNNLSSLMSYSRLLLTKSIWLNAPMSSEDWTLSVLLNHSWR